MIRIKTIAIIFSCLVIFFACYNSYTFKTEYKLDRASEEFIKQDYAAAEKLLRNLKNKISDTEYHLYMAYILRDKGAMERSNMHLQKAEEALDQLKYSPKQSRRIALETHLNSAFNAYLQKDYPKMSASIQKAAQTKKKHIWVAFFNTLEAFIHKNYALALEEWQEQPHIGYLSPWMRKSFGDKFDSLWYSIRLCEAKIALGNHQEARKQLHSLIYSAPNEQQMNINFLLGFSYLKEAEDYCETCSNPYYKEAVYYLSQVPIYIKDYQEEFLTAIRALHKHTLDLMDRHIFEDIPFYSQVLTKWHSALDITDLEQPITNALYKAIEERDWPATKKMTQALSHLNIDASKSHELEKTFLDLFQRSSTDDLIDELDVLYENLHLFTKKPKPLNRKLANIIGAQIFELLPIDTPDLFLTTPYFEFWMKLDDIRAYRYIFAQELIIAAGLFWSEEDQHDKALALFKFGAALPYIKDQSKIHQKLTATAEPLFTKDTANDNLLKSLKNILEYHSVRNEDNLKQPFFADSQETILLLSNADDDEEDMLPPGENQDPEGKKSLTILGLVEYYEENYAGALNHLQKIQAPGITALKALAISEMLAGDYEAGHALFQTFASHFAISNEEYQRLGFGFLHNEMPQESLKWFSPITPLPPEVIAGKCIAYFQAHQWKDALNEYKNLPNHFKSLPGLQRILLESTAAMGDFQSCSLLVAQILDNTKPAKEKNYSNIFVNFKKRYLDYQTPEFVVGIYYHKWKKDTAKALEYLQKISAPSPLISLNLAKILCEDKKYQEAYDVIVKAYPLKFLASLANKDQEDVLPILAEIEGNLSYFLESAEHYTFYFDSFPSQIKHRNRYAQTLMQLGLYPQAIQQWALIYKHQELTLKEKILYIECMVRLNQFKIANRTMATFLANDPAMPLEHKLELAKWLYITKNQPLLEAILSEIPNPSHRTLDVNQSLLKLWIEMGEHEKAAELITELKPKLQQTFEGLLILASFETKQAHSSEALNYANKAEKMQAFHPSIDSMIEMNEIQEIDLFGLKQQLSVLQIISQVHPMIATLKLEVAKKLIDVASKTPTARSKHYKEAMADLKQAHKILISLIDAYPEVPILYLLMGKYHYMNHDWEKAKESYEKSLSLNPSCLRALKSLSCVNALLGNQQEAYTALETALQFAPTDPDIWNKLGEFHHKNSHCWEAWLAFKQVVNFQPRNQKVLLQMSWVQLQLEIDQNDPRASAPLRSFKDFWGCEPE